MSTIHPELDEIDPNLLERLRKMVHRWPEVSGCFLQPEEHVVEGIVRGLARSQMMFGHSYCP